MPNRTPRPCPAPPTCSPLGPYPGTHCSHSAPGSTRPNRLLGLVPCLPCLPAIPSLGPTATARTLHLQLAPSRSGPRPAPPTTPTAHLLPFSCKPCRTAQPFDQTYPCTTRALQLRSHITQRPAPHRSPHQSQPPVPVGRNMHVDVRFPNAHRRYHITQNCSTRRVGDPPAPARPRTTPCAATWSAAASCRG